MRALKTPKLKSYGSMVSARLRELRLSRKLSIEQFRDKLAEHGMIQENGDRLAQSTVYSWERGKDNAGADLPVDYYPVIAAIYGFKSPHGWLPDQVPK